MKYWIHELHSERFGYVLGEKPLPAAPPSTPEEGEEAARQYGEQVYWEDYWDRNQDDGPGRRHAVNPNKAAATTPDAGASGIGITDDVRSNPAREAPQGRVPLWGRGPLSISWKEPSGDAHGGDVPLAADARG